MNYDLEDPYRTDDWKSTNSHKSKLRITYNNKIGNKTLHSRVFYALCIRPNDIGNAHLIYRPSRGQILVIKEYQSLHVPKGLIEVISKTNSSDNKIETIYSNNNQAIVQNDHSNNHNKNNHIHINYMNNPEDESHDELNSSPHLYGMEPNKIVNQEYKTILPGRPSKSTSIFMKHNGTTIQVHLHTVYF